ALIEKIKWLQYVFFSQWDELKRYATKGKVEIIGDMPFYVSYDSADVWANRDLFLLTEEGVPTGLAGVPPDYFNADGQLWGMPVFDWKNLKKKQYSWWV